MRTALGQTRLESMALVLDLGVGGEEGLKWLVISCLVNGLGGLVRKGERAIFEWFQIEQVDPEGC